MFTKLIALFFAIIVIAKAWTDFKKKRENWQMFLFWIALWTAVIVVAFDPLIITQVINLVGHRKTSIGQIVGIGFVFILYVVYRIYIKAHRLERQLNQLVRKLALRDLEKGKK